MSTEITAELLRTLAKRQAGGHLQLDGYLEEAKKAAIQRKMQYKGRINVFSAGTGESKNKLEAESYLKGKGFEVEVLHVSENKGSTDLEIQIKW